MSADQGQFNWDDDGGDYVRWTKVGGVLLGTVEQVRQGSYQGKSYPELSDSDGRGNENVVGLASETHAANWLMTRPQSATRSASSTSARARLGQDKTRQSCSALR